METHLKHEHGQRPSPAAAISREVVQSLKDATGRGPTQARTFFHEECILVLLREGHTVTEQTLAGAGGKRAVAQGRVDLSESIRQRLVAVAERNTGRKVVGFLSSSQQEPDLLSFVFVLDTSPVVRGGGAPPDGTFDSVA